MLLFEEVKELKEKQKKHDSAMWNVKEGKRLAEIHLDQANRKIAEGKKTWGEGHEAWKKEKVDLNMAKTGAENAKDDAKAKVLQIQGDLDRSSSN